MHVTRLVLDEFRNYRHLDLTIPEAGLRISGRNATGKTSVLEALVMLSTARSPRATADRDVVAWESGAEYGVPPYARIEAEIQTADGHRKVGISIELDPTGAALTRKQFLLNDEPVRAVDLVGAAKCVLFSPEDVVLVSGPPSERRRQMDILLSQVDRGYLRALSSYSKVLAQRNQLLRQFARERRGFRDPAAITELSFWDDELIGAGSHVMAFRVAAAAEIGERVVARSKHLVAGPEIGFRYVPRLELGRAEGNASQQAIAGTFHDAIEQRRLDEFRRGMTLVGPHRDDFTFTIAGRDLAKFGSRGQQRLGVVAYRLAEIDLITSRTGETPILLLDDVLSELDEVHRETLVTATGSCGCQVLVTSTDAAMLEIPAIGAIPMAEVRDGDVVVLQG
jgi:DNA replication and repair protein RecF